MLTLGAPLSREVGQGLPKVREFWWDISLGTYRGMGAELHAHVLYRQAAWTGVFRGSGVRLCRMLDINFAESPKGELRRISIPRTPVNKGKKKGRGLTAPGPLLPGFVPISSSLRTRRCLPALMLRTHSSVQAP